MWKVRWSEKKWVMEAWKVGSVVMQGGREANRETASTRKKTRSLAGRRRPLDAESTSTKQHLNLQGTTKTPRPFSIYWLVEVY